jgi:hypothetical protein
VLSEVIRHSIRGVDLQKACKFALLSITNIVNAAENKPACCATLAHFSMTASVVSTDRI